jgi:hypothetical protein
VAVVFRDDNQDILKGESQKKSRAAIVSATRRRLVIFNADARLELVLSPCSYLLYRKEMARMVKRWGAAVHGAPAAF